jgi:hypothetical protein
VNSFASKLISIFVLFFLFYILYIREFINQQQLFFAHIVFWKNEINWKWIGFNEAKPTKKKCIKPGWNITKIYTFFSDESWIAVAMYCENNRFTGCIWIKLYNRNGWWWLGKLRVGIHTKHTGRWLFELVRKNIEKITFFIRTKYANFEPT